MASSSSSSSSSKYDGVIKSGLKLKGGANQKEIGVKTTKKKKKSEHELELEQLQETSRLQDEQEQELAKGAARGPTVAEKAVQLAREKRSNSRIKEAITYTHRQRMDKLNIYLGSLGEHFDIPKVGPG
mmetsp:Transcript_43477/g.70460  ORF Transcript_43477/g.70460 Transcript_43477/m.70460 type:complete len:128 (-) Transcript_43477:111-494(-)